MFGVEGNLVSLDPVKPGLHVLEFGVDPDFLEVGNDRPISTGFESAAVWVDLANPRNFAPGRDQDLPGRGYIFGDNGFDYNAREREPIADGTVCATTN